MALKTFVKIGGITNLSDARYCSGMYVNLLGFAIEKSSTKFTSPALFSEITGWLSGMEYAAEFATTDARSALEILQDYPSVKWIEHEEIEELFKLAHAGYSLIWKCDLKLLIAASAQLTEKISQSNIMVHLCSENENLTAADQAAIGLIAQKYKIILGAGINSESVNDLVEKIALHGISLMGGDEIKPGLKDFDELADILEALELED